MAGIVVAGLLALALPAVAQVSIVVAAPTIIRVNFSIVIGSTGPSPPAAVQFTMTSPPGLVVDARPSAGSAARNATKTVTCSPFDVVTQRVVCVVYGTNGAGIAAGTVVNFDATVGRDTKLADLRWTLSELVAVDAAGNQVAMALK